MIGFTKYPTSNRVPGAYIEVDGSRANTGQANLRTLIVGQVVGTSLIPLNVASVCQGAAWTKANCGAGSMLALMVGMARSRDTFNEMWVLPLADDAAGVAAVGTLTLSGTAVVAGALPLYLDGQRIQVPVAMGQTAAQIAASVVSTAATAADLPVTVTVAGAVVTITARNKGLCGNDIDVRVAYLGQRGGEVVPAGLTVVIAPMTGGAVNPSLTAAFLSLADEPFDFIALPYSDTASLNAAQSLMDDNTGRWSWGRMIYGHVFTAMRGTIGQATTAGVTRNDQHTSIIAAYDSPSAPYLWAADFAATAGASLRVDPALPLQPPLQMGVLAPPMQSRFVLSDRNTLLYDGVSTFIVDSGGVVNLERAVTTYQRNAAGAPDNAYLDVETLATLAFVLRDLRGYLTTQFARKKLVSDATRITAGTNIVTLGLIRASVISRYRLMESLGMVQNGDAFAVNLLVESAGNGLVKIMWPVDLAGQLRQFAILAQFIKTT